MYRDHTPIGVDIGRESIKMLQLCRRGGQWHVAAGGTHVFGEEVRQGPGLRWRPAAEAIRSLLVSRSFRGQRVVLSLDHEQVLVKNARLPRMPQADLTEAVRWEAADRFPFDPNAGILRHVLAGDVRQGDEQRQELLLFAASDQTLREQLTMLDQAGCTPVGLDAKPLALARAMNHFWPLEATEEEPVRVLADLGAASCQMLIARADRIVFVKTIEIGSADLTRAVAEKVGTSFEDTLALRMRLGGSSEATRPADDDVLGDGSKIHRAMTAAMRPVIDRLAREITLCLRYYAVTFRGHRPTRLTLVGGASKDRLLVDLLSEALGLTVEVGRPLRFCRASSASQPWDVDLSTGGPEWAVALGCCLKPVVQAKRPSADVLPTPGAAAAMPNANDVTNEPAAPARGAQADGW